MLRRRGEQEWFLPKDFMQNDLGELFVGYEAGARLSELAGKYPEMFRSMAAGRFKARKFNFKEISIFIDKLPQDLSYIIVKEYPNYNEA